MVIWVESPVKAGLFHFQGQTNLKQGVIESQSGVSEGIEVYYYNKNIYFCKGMAWSDSTFVIALVDI